MIDPHQRPIELPPEISNPRIRKAAKEYSRLVGEHLAVSSAAHDLEQGRREAVEADRRAYAAAIRAGKGKDVDPGQPATTNADNEILKTRRREEALAVAVAEARNELVATVDRHRGEWSAALEKQREDARDKMREAVEQLADVHGEFVAAHASVAWLEHFPQQTRWASGRFAAFLPSLRTPAGEAVRTADAIAALRELAEPPPKPEQPATEPRKFSGAERRWVDADAA